MVGGSYPVVNSAGTSSHRSANEGAINRATAFNRPCDGVVGVRGEATAS